MNRRWRANVLVVASLFVAGGSIPAWASSVTPPSPGAQATPAPPDNSIPTPMTSSSGKTSTYAFTEGSIEQGGGVKPQIAVGSTTAYTGHGHSCGMSGVDNSSNGNASFYGDELFEVDGGISGSATCNTTMAYQYTRGINTLNGSSSFAASTVSAPDYCNNCSRRIRSATTWQCNFPCDGTYRWLQEYVLQLSGDYWSSVPAGCERSSSYLIDCQYTLNINGGGFDWRVTNPKPPTPYLIPN
jgi:hypothetical protein